MILQFCVIFVQQDENDPCTYFYGIITILSQKFFFLTFIAKKIQDYYLTNNNIWIVYEKIVIFFLYIYDIRPYVLFVPV